MCRAQKLNNHAREEKGNTTDIDLMGAKCPEVVPTVRIGLELEQRLVVWVVWRVLAQSGAGRRWLRLRGQDWFRVGYFFNLLEEFWFCLDSVGEYMC